VDELTAAILVETDQEVRNNLIKQAYDITTSEVAHIPLHQQAVAWAKKDSVDLEQRADNVFMLYHVNVK